MVYPLGGSEFVLHLLEDSGIFGSFVDNSFESNCCVVLLVDSFYIGLDRAKLDKAVEI